MIISESLESTVRENFSIHEAIFEDANGGRYSLWRVYRRVPDGRNMQFTKKVLLSHCTTKDEAFFEVERFHKKEETKARITTLLRELSDEISNI